MKIPYRGRSRRAAAKTLPKRWRARLAIVACLAAVLSGPAAALETKEGDLTLPNFHFRSGETLPQLHLHYTTLGTPQAGCPRPHHQRRADPARHRRRRASVPAAAIRRRAVQARAACSIRAKYFIILPDGIGHGKSSKPSDGLHAHFPHYDYDDMVAAQHALLTQGLHVNHLRLVMGTSMGCMHSFVWGETYPDFMDALMPLACLPVQIAGRNRMWRKMAMDAIRNDPAGTAANTRPSRRWRCARRPIC